jgi:hypothetical protein
MHGPVNGQIFSESNPKEIKIKFLGFFTAPNHLIQIQVLKNAAADQDIDTNWQTVGELAKTGTQTFFHNDPTPLYEWEAELQPGENGLSWPKGGVARVRARAVHLSNPQDPKSTLEIDASLRVFDEDFPKCKDENLSKSWQEIMDICGTRYGKRDVAHLLSSADLPSRKLKNQSPSPYLKFPFTNKPGGDQYYIASGIKILFPTLANFKAFFGFGTGVPNETQAVYYNAGDLGLGREMHCIIHNANARACYVTNYTTFDGNGDPIFGGDDNHIQDALDHAIKGFSHPGQKFANRIATVAMVEFPGQPILFMAFDANDMLTGKAKLDKSNDPNDDVPKNCMTCHAGKGSFNGAQVTDAHFLPFDLDSFQYSTRAGFTRDNQLEEFRKLNTIIQFTKQTDAGRDLLHGWYPPSGPRFATTPEFHGDFVPTAWAQDHNAGGDKLYNAAIKPYCRTCHIAQENLSWDTPEQFQAFKGPIAENVCAAGPKVMPQSLLTQDNFWNSSARAHILGYLQINKNACKPPQ